MYPTEKVPLLNYPSITYNLEDCLKGKSAQPYHLENVVPGRCHFNTMEELVHEYADEPTYGLCAMGFKNKKKSVSKLFGQMIHPENWRVVYPALLAFARKKDPTKCFSSLQYIRSKGSDEFVWYFSIAKYLKELDLLFTMDIPLSSMGRSKARAMEFLAESHYLGKNLSKLSLLTKREKEILQLISIGLDNGQMATKLFISRRTVEQHRKNIRKKLEVKSMAELYRYAQSFSLDDPQV